MGEIVLVAGGEGEEDMAAAGNAVSWQQENKDKNEDAAWSTTLTKAHERFLRRSCMSSGSQTSQTCQEYLLELVQRS